LVPPVEMINIFGTGFGERQKPLGSIDPDAPTVDSNTIRDKQAVDD